MKDLVSRYRKILDAMEDHVGAVLVAVSKGQEVEKIEALMALGHRDFGENYAQELLSKERELKGTSRGIRWHFLGHLQSNKVRDVIPVIHSIHSIDSEKLATEVQRRLEAQNGKRLSAFLEVNVDGESSKTGVSPQQARPLAKLIAEKCPNLDLAGLMCIPSGSQPRRAFSQLRELEQSCRPWTQGKLSMGMSADYLDALAEGATHIRVGTALFGEREAKAERR